MDGQKYNLRIRVCYINGEEFIIDICKIDNFIRTDTDDEIIGQIFCGTDIYGWYSEDSLLGMSGHRITMDDVMSDLRWMFRHELKGLEPTDGEQIKFCVPKVYNYEYQLKKEGEPFEGPIKQP